MSCLDESWDRLDDPVYQEEMRLRGTEPVKRGNEEQRTEIGASCTLYLLVAVPVMSGEETNSVPFELPRLK